MNNPDASFAQHTLLPDRDMIARSIAIMTPAHICGFPQDGGAGVGSYFGTDVEAATAFAIENCNRGFNMYWSVNETIADCGIKAKKGQIRLIRFAHLDLDPPKDGLSFDKEAALAEIRLDRPTYVVDSGNGWHVYWKLADPQDATPDNIEIIEGVNRAIIARYRGDPGTWNVDRILRVPGTINWPNAKKRASGRVPAPVIAL